MASLQVSELHQSVAVLLDSKGTLHFLSTAPPKPILPSHAEASPQGSSAPTSSAGKAAVAADGSGLPGPLVVPPAVQRPNFLADPPALLAVQWGQAASLHRQSSRGLTGVDGSRGLSLTAASVPSHFARLLSRPRLIHCLHSVQSPHCKDTTCCRPRGHSLSFPPRPKAWSPRLSAVHPRLVLPSMFSPSQAVPVSPTSPRLTFRHPLRSPGAAGLLFQDAHSPMAIVSADSCVLCAAV